MDPRSIPAPGPFRPARRGRRLMAAALASTLLVGGASCADSDDVASGETSSSKDAQALEPAVKVDPGPAPVVDLINAGQGERRVVEYAPSREPAVVAVTRSATARTEVPGEESRTDDTPAQTLTLRGESEPDVDGAQRATVVAEEFTSVDELRNAQFATAPGFTVTWNRSANGIVRELSLEAPTGATDAARAGVEITANAVSDATVAFPTEEIGVGARWTVTRQVDDAVAPERVVAYQLVDLDGDVATVQMDVTPPDTADTLTAPSPDGGPDVTLDVTAYRIVGTGELTIDLRAALPVGGQIESSSRAIYADPESGRETYFDEDSVLEFRSVD